MIVVCSPPPFWNVQYSMRSELHLNSMYIVCCSAPSGISQMICLESDNESENCGMGTRDKNEPRDSRWISNSMGSGSSPGICLESDNELENCGMDKPVENEPRDSRWTSNSTESGSSPHICLESDNELENCGMGERGENELRESRWTSNSMGFGSSPGICLLTSYICSSPPEMLCLFVYVIENSREAYFVGKCYSNWNAWGWPFKSNLFTSG